jgi:hypothetical protein
MSYFAQEKYCIAVSKVSKRINLLRKELAIFSYPPYPYYRFLHRKLRAHRCNPVFEFDSNRRHKYSFLAAFIPKVSAYFLLPQNASLFDFYQTDIGV